MKALKTLLITALLVLPLWANAQQQIPPVIFDEMHHPHGRMNPNNPNSPYYTPPPREVWEDRYGAIATDFSAGRGGAGESKTSARAARREALRQCGTRNCKIAAESRNGCLATAYGGGITGIGVGNTEAQATEDAINSCEIRGSNCEPRYVHCNLPVRIR